MTATEQLLMVKVSLHDCFLASISSSRSPSNELSSSISVPAHQSPRHRDSRLTETNAHFSTPTNRIICVVLR